MRHIYIRGILALVWVAAAIVSGMSGSLGAAALYMIMGGLFLYAAYTARNRNQSGKGDQ